MYKLPLLCFCLLLFLKCQSQTNAAEQLEFEKYTISVLEDSTNRWSEYPKPPRLTVEVLSGLKKEFEDDSVKYYFDYLKFSNKKTQSDYMNCYSYFDKHSNNYCILVMMSHWNPDVRVYTMTYVNEKIKAKQSFETRHNSNLKLNGNDLSMVKQLIYLLESNPLFISGSENATIHGNYITLITWNLDLLTGENNTKGQQLREWYKNDLQFESAVLKWKSHIPSK